MTQTEMGPCFYTTTFAARKWRDAQRFPAGVLVPAVKTVPDFDPGHTFVVHELVRAGDPITLYSTKKIPTTKDLILRNKVYLPSLQVKVLRNGMWTTIFVTVELEFWSRTVCKMGRRSTCSVFW